MTQSPQPALAYGGSYRQEGNVPPTLVHMLQRTVQRPIEKGIIYLQDDGSEIYQPYAGLYEESLRILAGFSSCAVLPGDKVILQLEHNQDYLPALWACIMGGVVAIPISIATSYEKANTTTTLLQKAWELCDHPLIITNAPLEASLYTFASIFDLPDLRVVTIESLRAFSSRGVSSHTSQPDDMAMILFTSGSTGIPKGAIRTHQHLISYARGLSQMLKLSDQEITFHWLPLTLAMGLTSCHLRDIYLGCQQIHASPQTILRDPLSWIDSLDRYHATCSMAPNFAFGLVNERAETIAQRQWDLSALRSLVISGEVVVPKVVRKFLELLCPHGLPEPAVRPFYGMTEALGITITTFLQAGSTDADRVAEVGIPLPDVWVRIANEQNQVLQEGEGGRVQVRSRHVISGYYRNQELNQEVFTSDGWFETGDIGILNKGQLTITGRIKDIIIVNGINFSCQEIEAVVERIVGIEASYVAACAVRTAESSTDALAIFYSSQLREEHELSEQARHIRKQVVSVVGINPTYLIPVSKEVIPKTALGKIQRTRLKQQFEDGVFKNMIHFKPEQVEAYPPTRELEQHLRTIWQSVLGRENVGINETFFELGGDSLLAIRVMAQAHRAGIHIRPGQIFHYQTIAELATVLENQPISESQETEGDPEGQSHPLLPLTVGQMTQLLEAYNPHYFNEGFSLQLRYALNESCLRKTVWHLMRHHDALRLRFIHDGTEWKQQLLPLSPPEQLPVTWIILSTMSEQEQDAFIEQHLNTLHANFNLFEGQVMHMVYYDLGPHRPHRFIWQINHVVVDYYSTDILLEDFHTIYQQLEQGEEVHLPSRTTSFEQWVEHLSGYMALPKIQQEMEDYWLQLPWNNVALPPVSQTTTRQHYGIATRYYLESNLNGEATSALLQFARKNRVPLVDILLTALMQVFAHWLGSPWVYVNVSDHGRNTLLDDKDLSRTVGYFSWERHLLLECRETDSFEKSLEDISKQVAAVPHKGLGYGLLYCFDKQREQLQSLPRPHIYLNYLSRASHEQYNSSPLLLSVERDIGRQYDPQELDDGPSTIAMTAEIFPEYLKLSWEYQSEIYTSTTIEYLVQDYLQRLHSLAVIDS